MNKKEKQLLKIRRNYRITPSKDLQDFWKKVDTEDLNQISISFRFFTFKLLTLEEVAEFDYKAIRAWFKNRSTYHFVRYYLPFATSASGTYIVGFDHSKNYLGIFLSNLQIDPVFITTDIFKLLKGNDEFQDKAAFLKERVSKPVMRDFDFGKSFLKHYQADYEWKEDEDEYTDEEIKELSNEYLFQLIEYIQKLFNAIDYSFDLKIKPQKTTYKFTFPLKEKKKHIGLSQEITIPKLSAYSNSIDFVIPLLNNINQKWWNGASSTMQEYGFYRTFQGIALLHIHQVCEFIRLGLIPCLNNVKFPPIIFSKHPSGYVNTLEYEIATFETQEESRAYYRNFNIESKKLSVRNLTKKDIPKIVDHFLDTPISQLTIDGLDPLKIPSEEQLIADLKRSLDTAPDEQLPFYLLLEKGGNTYGHCHIEQKNEAGEAYLYFYNWLGFLRQADQIDPLIQEAIQLMRKTFSLQAIYAEPTQEDEYRNGVFERLGFELIKKHTTIRDAMSLEKTYHVWKLNLTD